MEKVTNEQEFWAFMSKLTEERERRDAEWKAIAARQDAELKAISTQTDLKIQALAEKIAKTEEQLAKTDAQLAKTDAQLAKTDAQLAKTDAQLAKTDAQLAKTDARLDKLFARTDAQMARTDARLDRLSELVGGIANNQGQVAEEFFYHSLANRLQVADIKFDAIYRNLGGRVNGLQDEFDLILVNGDVLAMFEVKTKAHVNLVDTMLQRKIPNLRKVLPCFKDYKIYAGIASLVTYDELIGRTKEQGLFLLTQQGDHIEVINQNVRDF